MRRLVSSGSLGFAACAGLVLMTCWFVAGCGSGNNGFVPGPTPPPNSEFLFVPVQDSNFLAILVIGSNGALSDPPTPVIPTGSQPVWAAVDPTNHFVYVTNFASNTVSAYTFSTTAGRIAGSAEFTTGIAPGAVAVDPSGKFAYVANDGSNNVSGFKINSDGSLTAVPGSPFPAGSQPQQGIAVTTQYVYVSNLASNDVSAYHFDASTGALTPLAGSPFTLAPAGAGPESLAINPAGTFLFTANMNSDNVSAFSVNADGSLTAVPGSPFAAGRSPQYLVTDRTGSHLFVVNVSDTSVTSYSIVGNGALTPIASSGTGFVPEGLVVDASNKFLYVANCGDGTLSAFAINSDGTLALLGNFIIGGCPQAVATTH